MSDVFGNHIVGFPTRRLICSRIKTMFNVVQRGLEVHIKIYHEPTFFKDKEPIRTVPLTDITLAKDVGG